MSFIQALPRLSLSLVFGSLASTTTWRLRGVIVPNPEQDAHVQSLGLFAVKRHNEQSHGSLRFIKVVFAETLDRGTGHFTFRLIIVALDGSWESVYWSEVLQDLGAPGQPPVLNLGSFVPLCPPKPSWVHVPNISSDQHVQSLGNFAVKRHNEQTHGSLKFFQVVDGLVLDRGTEHYTYHLILSAEQGGQVKYYKVEVFQDLSAPGQPLVLNLGYFDVI